MSMFYELMMRSKMKVEEMPLTIVGNPTVVDGVVSGFSENDYLKGIVIDFSKPFELMLKFTTSGISNPQYLWSTRYSTSSGLDLYIPNYKMRIWGTTNGTSLDVSAYSPNALADNTTYWYKLIYNVNNIKAELSTDGTTFTEINDVALANQIVQNSDKFCLGRSIITVTNFWRGSIDIPNCYLITNGTKYIFTLPQ